MSNKQERNTEAARSELSHQKDGLSSDQSPSNRNNSETGDARSSGYSVTRTPYNTRETTFLSKESSETICSEPGGGSKTPSFVSVNETLHLAAKVGTLPQNSPTADQPLVDSSGNVRHVSPKNVKLEQYYPEVEESPEGDSTGIPKSGSVGALTTVEHELTQNTLASSSDKQEIDAPRADGKVDDTKKESQRDGGEQDGAEDTEAEVFPTQVDEEVITAAQARQTSLYDPPWLLSDYHMASFNEVLFTKAEEHFCNGLENARNSQFQNAIQCFNKAIHLKPKDLRFFVQRGECYLHMVDFQSAILNYKRACVLDPENGELYQRLAFIYFFHGQCLFDQKLFPEALEAFSRATEMRPDVIGYHTRSIACLAALERHGECLALVNKRLEVEQENADLYVMRARLHQLFRNTTLAYYDVKDALNIHPDHTEARAFMAKLEAKSVELKNQAMHLNLMGRHRDALQKISLAIETNPSVAEYHVTRGALHRRLGDFNAAIDDYLLALDKTDHNEDNATYLESQRQLLLTYNDFAVECFSKGYYEEAIILLNKAIKGEKREKGLYINRGDCFFKEGNFQFAMADYHQALELDPTDRSIRSRIAVIHNEYGVQEFQAKNFEEAENRFTLAIQHGPHVSNYYISRCRTRQMLENHSGARQDILMALLLDPSNPELMPILARLYPGKSVKDILLSKAAVQARQALDNLVITASPIVLKSFDHGSERSNTTLPQTAEDGTVTMETKQAEARSLWQPDRCLPDLKTCMEEKEFNIKLALEKRKYNTKVKHILHKRPQLKPVTPRIKPHPPSSGAPIKNNLSPTHQVSVDGKVQVKPATGWRNFGFGVSLADAPT